MKNPMNNLNKIKTKRGDIALFTVLILAMVMMALLFNISIKTNVDISTSRDTNLSQQAYNKAIKGAEAWIECASDPENNTDPVNLGNCNNSSIVNDACSQESNNGVLSECEEPTYVTGDIPYITVKAKAANGAGKTVNRVVTIEFSN